MQRNVHYQLIGSRVPSTRRVRAAGWAHSFGKFVALRSRFGQKEFTSLAVGQKDADVLCGALGVEAIHLFATEGDAHHSRRDPIDTADLNDARGRSTATNGAWTVG